MAKRKHLPVLTAGEKYEGWMGFSDGEPFFDSQADPPSAEAFATKTDAQRIFMDVRQVTIFVHKPKGRTR